MSETRVPVVRLFSRREVLGLATGIGAAALPIGRSFAASPPVASRPIPRTGERLPVIGLGTAIVFDVGSDAAKRSERSAVIRTMIEGGARLIDTAPSYGTAEDVLGDLLAAMGWRDRIFLATKVRVAGPDASVAEMRRSLERLRTGRVDLMQLHNVREASADLRVLREWRDKGFARYVGITSTQPNTYDDLAEVIRR